MFVAFVLLFSQANVIVLKKKIMQESQILLFDIGQSGPKLEPVTRY